MLLNSCCYWMVSCICNTLVLIDITITIILQWLQSMKKKKTCNYLLATYIIFQCSFIDIGFEIIIQWLQSMKRKTCKLSTNKTYKICDDHCCVHEAIWIKCRN